MQQEWIRSLKRKWKFSLVRRWEKRKIWIFSFTFWLVRSKTALITNDVSPDCLVTVRENLDDRLEKNKSTSSRSLPHMKHKRIRRSNRFRSNNISSWSKICSICVSIDASSIELKFIDFMRKQKKIFLRFNSRLIGWNREIRDWNIFDEGEEKQIFFFFWKIKFLLKNFYYRDWIEVFSVLEVLPTCLDHSMKRWDNLKEKNFSITISKKKNSFSSNHQEFVIWDCSRSRY